MSAQASYIADAAAERKRTVDDMNMMEGVEGVDAMGHQYSQDSPIKKRQMEKQQYSKVYGQKALELLQVTDENFQLASEVFDCLDIDKNQRLEKDDFNGGSEEVLKIWLAPIGKTGIDFHTFLSRIVDKIWEYGLGSDAELQTIRLQQYTLGQLVLMAAHTMNANLKQFLMGWRLMLQEQTGSAVGGINLTVENMQMLLRLYNFLDREFGDGDGVLSKDDEACWTQLKNEGLVDDASTNLSFTEFRDAYVEKVLWDEEIRGFTLDTTGFGSHQAAIEYVHFHFNKIMYEKALTPLAKSMGFATVEECPPGASDLDNAPKSYEHRLSADPAAEATKMRAFNIELEDSTVQKLVYLFQGLDADKEGTLDAQDFQERQVPHVWQSLQAEGFDEDGDEYITLPEFLKGMSRLAMRKTLAEFESTWPANIPIGHFIYGEPEEHWDRRRPRRYQLAQTEEARSRLTLRRSVDRAVEGLHEDLCREAQLHRNDGLFNT